MELTYNSSGNFITFCAKEVNLKQEDIARRLNVHQTEVSMAITELRKNPASQALRMKIIDLIKKEQKKKKAA